MNFKAVSVLKLQARIDLDHPDVVHGSQYIFIPSDVAFSNVLTMLIPQAANGQELVIACNVLVV